MIRYLFVFLLFKSILSFSQEKFTNPLDIPMYLSGSFAELRSNHFHSGIDIKTKETTGWPVYAVKDGWISRIKISPWGYGNAIYIDHPNGYTSVYGHLEGFNEKISEIVLSEQYREKTFSFDKYFKEGEWPIEQAEIIAYTGNTGGSGGPHLHFELRERKTQNPINPLQFNFDVLDTIPPVFKEVFVYKKEGKESFKPLLIGDEYLLADTVMVHDDFELGIVTNDRSNYSTSHLGINKIDYYLDHVLMYSYKNDKFSFLETRYVNAHIDYAEYKTTGKRVQKLFVDPGNHLRSYSVFGKYKQIKCGKLVRGRIEIEDSKKNKSVLNILFKRTCPKEEQLKEKPSKSLFFSFREDNDFKTNTVSVHIPKGALYTNIYFTFETIEDLSFIGNTIYAINKETVALQKNILLKIRIPSIDKYLVKKLVIVRKNKSSIYAKKTHLEGQFLTTQTRDFGMYSIAIDTVNPKVVFKSFDKNNLKEFLQLSISDNLSGISKYNGYIDGQWVLFKYDYKTKKLYYSLDKHLKKENRNRILLINVSDSVGNTSVLEKQFFY